MLTTKKMVLTIVAMIVALVMVLSALVIVFVAGNQSGATKIKVKYTAIDVATTIYANCYIGEDVYPFTTQQDGEGDVSISLTPNGSITGNLYQKDSEEGLKLSKDNNKAVYEYIFQNDTANIDDKGIDINIALLSYPGYNNGEIVEGESEGMNIRFAVSNTPVTDFDTLQLSNTYTDVQLYAQEEVGAKTYIYIVVSVADLLYNATFKGSFEWILTRAS